MIGLERQRQMFAAQFEPQGEGFLYRKHSIGDAVPVTAADRDRFVAAFDKFTRQGFWAFVAFAVALLAGLVAYSFATGTQVSDNVFYIVFGAMFAVYIVSYLNAWNAPAKELRGRG